jgi:hypothetical protein
MPRQTESQYFRPGVDPRTTAPPAPPPRNQIVRYRLGEAVEVIECSDADLALWDVFLMGLKIKGVTQAWRSTSKIPTRTSKRRRPAR